MSWWRIKYAIVDWSPFYRLRGYYGPWRRLNPLAYARLLWSRFTAKADPYPERPKNGRLNVRVETDYPRGSSIDWALPRRLN
jgi:hypothetical protein